MRTLILLLLLAASTAANQRPPAFVARTTGAGPDILFIPGLTSPGSVWDDAVKQLQPQFTCHVITLAGFAGVPPVEQPSLRHVRDELIAYIRGKKIHKPVIVGHSVGGFLAYWLAAQYPDEVGGVVSLDGAMYLPALFDSSATPETTRAQAEGMRRAIEALTPDAFARQSDAQLERQIGAATKRERVANAAAQSDPRTTAQYLYELYTTDLRPAARSIRVPVLLLVGTAGIPADARGAYMEAARRQLTNVQRATVREVSTARHFIQLDAPDEFAIALNEFLGRVHR